MSVTENRQAGMAPPHSILIAVDASPASRLAMQYTAKLAPKGARITVISVAENPRALMAAAPVVAEAIQSSRDELLRDAADAVAQAREVFAGCDVVLDTAVVDLATRGGDMVHALAEEAEKRAADLLVVGARQHHGLLRWVEGTVSEPLTRLSRCPLLIVPQHYAGPIDHVPRRILFPVDGSATATSALRYGSKLATPDSHLRAVYVVDRAIHLSDIVPVHLLEGAFTEEGNAALAAATQILSGVEAPSSTSMIRTARTADDIAHTIVRDARHWHADLIVMGTHGRRGIARWFLGSVAGRVAKITETPLLLVHTTEH